jgi:hypothetical protein
MMFADEEAKPAIPISPSTNNVELPACSTEDRIASSL